MKNLKVSAKLIVSFLLVMLLAVAVGVVGIIGMTEITNADTEMYEKQTKPLPYVAKALEYSQRLRVQIRNAIIYEGNAEQIQATETNINDRIKNFETFMSEYDDTIVNDNAQTAFDTAMTQYTDVYKPGMLKVLADAKAGASREQLIKNMEDIEAAATIIVDNLTTCMNIKVADGETASNNNDALSRQLLILIVAVLAVAIITAMCIAAYISRLISRPMQFMKDIMMRIGTRGDLDFTDAEYREAEIFASAQDEIGQSVDMMLTMVRRLVKVGDSLKTVADGDLTSEISLLSETDTMGLSLHQMVDNLNHMFSEINSSTAQVATGSKQIADGAQALAQGSTQQAAAVEELSSSITEVAEKTKENADMATKASRMAEAIKVNAEKGSHQMDTMMDAVKEINDASQSINKVIKVIDDIAFQTNILALNAAVEAARAGQHGKGFAVVAEEVRSLAAKSAEAAKDTGALIANSMEKAELGARIAGETASSLTDIVTGINESTKIVSEIAKSSEEQSMAISQINKGIDQVAQVVQQNSATAEESAAASEEMSGQSLMLENLIAQFKLKDSNRPAALGTPAPRSGKKLSMPTKTSYTPQGEEFGKY